MEVFSQKSSLIEYIDSERVNGKIIGLVPTMGALHDGHLELIRWSARECNITICSIYVNPTQFNNPEDLKHYPRDLEQDMEKLASENCSAVFLPDNHEMYEDNLNPSTTINFGNIETILEGTHRPGHFKGVGIVVSKLFNIVNPDYTYFGQKDIQQYAIVKQLINDLSFGIILRCVPTIREPDGLAMSSRNSKLSSDDRGTAVYLYKTLVNAKEKLLKDVSFATVKKESVEFLTGLPNFILEYLEFVDTEPFRIIDRLEDGNNPALCIAADLGGVRLIDNLLII
ncbi:pantoate--beta-alanine ligase [Bacteroidota bacterium]